MIDLAPTDQNRGFRERVAGAWAAGGPAQRTAILVGGTVTLAIGGAFLFGVWHVLFGWLVKGNPRAGAFGLVLAAASAALLRLEAVVIVRRWPGGRPGGSAGSAP